MASGSSERETGREREGDDAGFVDARELRILGFASGEENVLLQESIHSGSDCGGWDWRAPLWLRHRYYFSPNSYL